MPFAVIVMAAVLVVALLVILIVSVGMRRSPKGNASELTLFMARTGKHLNGQAEPPAKLQSLVESIPLPRSASSATDKN